MQQVLTNTLKQYYFVTVKNSLLNMLRKFKRNDEGNNGQKNTQGSTSSKRMALDIQQFNQNKIQDVVLTFPKQGNINQLHLKIIANEKSFYHDSVITFSFIALQQYPYTPPEVKCLNKILHPNIDKSGNAKWLATYDMAQVAFGLLHLINHIKAADIEDPLDTEAAALMNQSSEKFEKIVQETIRGKSYLGRTFDNIYQAPKNK